MDHPSINASVTPKAASHPELTDVGKVRPSRIVAMKTAKPAVSIAVARIAIRPRRRNAGASLAITLNGLVGSA